VSERRSRDDPLHDLQPSERQHLDEPEPTCQPRKAIGTPARPGSERPDHHGRHPGQRQDECRLRRRGEVLVARPLQDERTMVWIRDGDQVGEHVTEDQAGHGEPERRESTEPGFLTHAASLLLQERA
jgi:hypothetical protein